VRRNPRSFLSQWKCPTRQVIPAAPSDCTSSPLTSVQNWSQRVCCGREGRASDVLKNRSVRDPRWAAVIFNSYRVSSCDSPIEILTPETSQAVRARPPRPASDWLNKKPRSRSGTQSRSNTDAAPGKPGDGTRTDAAAVPSDGLLSNRKETRSPRPLMGTDMVAFIRRESSTILRDRRKAPGSQESSFYVGLMPCGRPMVVDNQAHWGR